MCMSKYNSWHRSAKWITGYHPHLFHWLPRKKVRFQIQRPTSKQAITLESSLHNLVSTLRTWIVLLKHTISLMSCTRMADRHGEVTLISYATYLQFGWNWTVTMVNTISCKVAGQCERSDKIGKIKSYILAFKYDTVTEMGDNWRELCSWGQWPIHKPALLPMVISYHTQEIKKTSAV